MRKPKGYLEWVKKLESKPGYGDDDDDYHPMHYTMEYSAADGYTGKQIMEYIEYMKSKDKGSCLIGTDFVYCLMDRVAVLEEVIRDAQKRNRRGM